MCFVDGVPFLRCLGFTFQRLVFIVLSYLRVNSSLEGLINIDINTMTIQIAKSPQQSHF